MNDIDSELLSYSKSNYSEPPREAESNSSVVIKIYKVFDAGILYIIQSSVRPVHVPYLSA